jgi:hypothetical protein
MLGGNHKPRAFRPSLVSGVINQLLSTHHGIHKLHTVVFGRIVAGSDHDSNSLTIQLAGTESREEADTESDRIEEIP